MDNQSTYNDLLKKLADGSISQQERWELQKASLDDPFLADALEGYHLSEGETNIAILEKRLEEQHQNGKSRTLFPFRKWMSIAAGLILLLGSGYWMTQVNTSNNQNTTAEVDQPVPIPHESKQDDTIEPSETKDKPEPELLNKAATSTPSIVQEKKQPTRSMSEIPVSEKTEPVTINTRQEKKRTEEITQRTRPPLTPIEASEMDNEELESQRKAAVSLAESDTESEDLVISAKEEIVVDSDPLLEQDLIAISQGNMANAGPIERIPRIAAGIVSDEKGVPLAGVDILDRNQNILATTDSSGQFFLPDLNGYIMTSFNGYEPITAAVSPEINIELRPAAKDLSERPKRLIEMMDDAELRNHYTNQLNTRLSQNWPICSTRWVENNEYLPHTITVNIEIGNDGRVNDIEYFRPMPETCTGRINSIIEASQSIFEKNRPMTIMLRVNL